MDADRVERERKKLNVCIMHVPESSKRNAKDREEADRKFCADTLKIDAEAITAVHRAGSKYGKDAEFCRPLIVKMVDEEAVDYWTLNGRGYNTGYEFTPGKYIYINKDRCKADRDAHFRTRKAMEERRKEAEKKKKKDLKNAAAVGATSSD